MMHFVPCCIPDPAPATAQKEEHLFKKTCICAEGKIFHEASCFFARKGSERAIGFEWQPNTSYKVGEISTCKVEKRGLRRLWAWLTGKPLAEIKQFKCVAVHTGTKREDIL